MRELDHVTEWMRRVLDDTYAASLALAQRPGGERWSPLVDVEEVDDAYLIEAELPSVKREDIDIELIGNDLEITGEVPERERTGTLRRQTRRTGRFEYRMTLPDRIDPDKIEAKLADGVLTVRVAKSESDKRRRIEIGS